MKGYVQKLSAISNNKTRTIIGLMSGTSLDGLDVALCEISGFGEDTNVTLKNFVTIGYPQEVKSEIRKIFGKDTIDL